MKILNENFFICSIEYFFFNSRGEQNLVEMKQNFNNKLAQYSSKLDEKQLVSSNIKARNINKISTLFAEYLLVIVRRNINIFL